MRTDNFKIIQEILTNIESQLDDERIDWSLFSAEALNVTEPRWLRLMRMITEAGLIDGFSYVKRGDRAELDIKNVRLTLAGLEYLRKNVL
jgi:hypothetical protein